MNMKTKMMIAAVAATLASTSAQAAVTYSQSALGSTPAAGTTITFDTATPEGFSVKGGVIQSGDNEFGKTVTGSSNYLTTNLASGTGSASIFSKVGFNTISFDWGTIDTYNTFGLLDAAGNAFYTMTGQQIVPHDSVNGSRISLTSDQSIYGLRLFSNSPAFEVDNVTFSATAVPEPGTWGMMVIGFGAMGLAMRRRSSPKSRSVLA